MATHFLSFRGSRRKLSNLVGNYSRHAEIKYEKAGLAAPNTCNFADFHDDSEDGAHDCQVEVFRCPTDYIRCCNIVVSPKDLDPDGVNDCDIKSLLLSLAVVTDQRSPVGKDNLNYSTQTEETGRSYKIEEHDVIIRFKEPEVIKKASRRLAAAH
jgi:hypothetical protein